MSRVTSKVMLTCQQCGSEFYAPPSRVKRVRDASCSVECAAKQRQQKNQLKRDASGKKKRPRGIVVRNNENPMGVAERRLVASSVIGRKLTRDEVVIHIDNSLVNNQPENLFICKSRSEFMLRRNGSLPWPTRSNLDCYEAVLCDEQVEVSS